MGFWSWLTGDDARTFDDVEANDNPAGVAPASVGTPDYTPGDPDGFELLGDPLEWRALPQIVASSWDGWPAGWEPPYWQNAAVSLIDTAWACIDLNSSVLSAMPVYKLRNGQIVEPETWMVNPDPRIYSSWNEFAKELWWDYQMGEAFVLATDYFSSGWPMFFRTIPPETVKVEWFGMERRYSIGQIDVTNDILHIRYKNSRSSPRGIGPLDAAGARVTAAGVMARYTADVVRNGGISMQTLETDQPLPEGAAQDISDQWVEARRTNLARPPVLDAGIKLVDHQVSPKDMALLELSQFTDSRIAILLGVPPFLMGLPSGGDSMTYSNVSSLFDYHDRASLRPKAAFVMAALSQWALPRGSSVELNRDEYSRPALPERAGAYATLHGIGAITNEEIRTMERLLAASSNTAAAAISGSSMP